MNGSGCREDTVDLDIQHVNNCIAAVVEIQRLGSEIASGILRVGTSINGGGRLG